MKHAKYLIPTILLVAAAVIGWHETRAYQRWEQSKQKRLEDHDASVASRIAIIKQVDPTGTKDPGRADEETHKGQSQRATLIRQMEDEKNPYSWF